MSAFTNRQRRRHPEMFGTWLYAPDGDEAGAGGGGGAGTAVLEKPADGLTVDAAAAGAGDGEDDAAGADGAAVSGETGKDDKGKTPVLDEEGEKIAAARVAEALQANERERAETAAREADELAEQAHLEELRNHHTTHEKKLADALAGFGVFVESENKTYNLNPEQRDTLAKEVLQSYEKDAAASIGLRLRETLTRQVLAKLPEADRAAAQKKLDAADPKDFMDVAGDVYAPQAKSLQELDLDGVLGLSAKAKRGHLEAVKVAADAAKKAERQRIYDLHGITLDEPALDGTPAGGSNELSYAQFLKLKEPDKAKWKAANPEKFDAFLGIKKGK